MERQANVGWGWKRTVKQKLIKPQLRSNWYYWVILSKKWSNKNFLLHRLIANSFIKREDGRDYINHKNWVKTDNRLENLERCTLKENKQHAFNKLWQNNILKYPWQPKWKKHFRTKKVLQISKCWSVVWEYWGCCEASRETWIHRDWINHVINWRKKTAWWYTWKYA